MFSTILSGCQNASLAHARPSSRLGNETRLHVTILKGFSHMCFPWVCLPNTNKLSLLNNPTDDLFTKQLEKVVVVVPLVSQQQGEREAGSL